MSSPRWERKICARDSVAGSDGTPPVFVPVSEAEAIAQRSSLYEAFDLVRGVFGGAPPRPRRDTMPG